MSDPQGIEQDIDYALVIKQLRRELDGLDGRRRILEAAIAGLIPLVKAEQEPQLPGIVQQMVAPKLRPDLPAIPPGFFTGKTPTQAYRDLMKLWPGQYSPPQMADAFIIGGMGRTRPELVQQIHSVLKRERKRARREKAAAANESTEARSLAIVPNATGSAPTALASAS